jgi:hypothetical protein
MPASNLGRMHAATPLAASPGSRARASIDATSYAGSA